VLTIGDEQVIIATGQRALAIQGVTNLDGGEVSIAEWVHRWSLAEGDELRGLSTAQRVELTALDARLVKNEAYWLTRLGQLIPLEIPYCMSRAAASGTADWGHREFELPASFTSNLETYPTCDAVIAAVCTYFARISSQPEFDLTLCDHSRCAPASAYAQLVAPHVPLRVCIGPTDSYQVIYSRIKESLAEVRRRETWLYDVLSRYPELRNREELRAGRVLPVAIHVAAEQPCTPTAGTQLAIAISPEATRYDLIYDRSQFDDDSAATIVRQITGVLDQLGRDTNCALKDLKLFSADERTTILDDWNPPQSTDRPGVCVHNLFEQQVQRTPLATAVTFESHSLTYLELDQRANQVAACLRRLGVGPDQRVGIHIERSLDMVVGVLGILKAGGAYVPLDPSFPPERLNFMAQDAGIHVLLTHSELRHNLQFADAQTVCIDKDLDSTADRDAVASGVQPQHLAYVIYTSGSTGVPKGVMVEHTNVASFFAGMDEQIEHDPPGTWLAVTTLSFDISVLEVLWTLCRGFHVVVHSDRALTARAHRFHSQSRPMQFSLFYWGNDDTIGGNKYELLLEGSRFADTHGFVAVWTPERHFHAFGGPYPNPAVTGAAIAAVTRHVQIRAGSCVLPLHHPIRVAEEWAVVDNLSNGRAAVAFASGWQPHDFVVRPESFRDHKSRMFDDMRTVQRLWRGESVEFPGPHGDPIPRMTQPRPVQAELPVWVTTAGNPETYGQAGQCGANVLTHLLGQSVDEVGEKIRIYRAARQAAGYDPATGIVTLMLHTLVAESDDQARAIVRQPMKDYLRSSVSLVSQFSWAFPAFKRPKGGAPADVDLTALSSEELDAVLEFAFERYFVGSGLFGSVDTCLRMVNRLKAIGVDEIACLIDFGVPAASALEHLPQLDHVRRVANTSLEAGSQVDDYSIAALIARHSVTHLQCTPSLARILLSDDKSRAALGRLKHVLVGGEALPPEVARQLQQLVRGTVTNMYGPTETTVWASTYRLGDATDTDSIPIGRPIAGARMYILDRFGSPAPPAVPGELFIGGNLVVRGYHQRPELTKERFCPDPFSTGATARMYRTGDLARWRRDGNIEFLGRIDDQVKIRGYRIELGEIAARLARHPLVRESVVIVREDIPGDQRLVAYVVPQDTDPQPAELREFLRRDMPEYMVPAHFVSVQSLPLTPNGKIDRRRLPALAAHQQQSVVPFAAPSDHLQSSIANLWCETLGIDIVGVDDNFFDVGGHSLLVIRLHRELGRRLRISVSLTDLYRYPTIRSLVAHLSAEDPDSLQHSDQRAQFRRASLSRRRQRSGDK
jgi:natural product biosynthesis luciferase-like monooxygenase protein